MLLNRLYRLYSQSAKWLWDMGMQTIVSVGATKTATEGSFEISHCVSFESTVQCAYSKDASTPCSIFLYWSLGELRTAQPAVNESVKQDLNGPASQEGSGLTLYTVFALAPSLCAVLPVPSATIWKCEVSGAASEMTSTSFDSLYMIAEVSVRACRMLYQHIASGSGLSGGT